MITYLQAMLKAHPTTALRKTSPLAKRIVHFVAPGQSLRVLNRMDKG